MMYRFALALLLTLGFHSFVSSPLRAEETQEAAHEGTGAPETSAPFEPFTGKIVRNKVRLRLQPTLEGHIVKEIQKGDHVIVVSENEDFYGVKPPSDMRFYVFRTYVLDNIIEASRVNIRLEPSTESPIVGKLNYGESIQGEISPEHNKWYAISPPDNVVFWVAKEYVENVGPKELFANLESRKKQIDCLFSDACCDTENTSPSAHFAALEKGISSLKQIIENFTDFPEEVKRAKQQLVTLQEEALEVKLALLDKRQGELTILPADKKNNMHQKKDSIDPTNSSVGMKPALNMAQSGGMNDLPAFALDAKPTFWREKELNFYQHWLSANPESSLEDFYKDEIDHAVVLHGIVQPYQHYVKNKPGDFVLVNVSSRSPMAYLYSNHLPLENLIGKEVTITVSERPNNHFAFPAYYVLAAE